MQCEEWADANSELFKEAHDETVHKNSYKRKLYELISASLMLCIFRPPAFPCSAIFDFPLNLILTKILSAIHAGHTKRGCEEMIYIFSQPLFLFPMIGGETLIDS